MEKFRTSPPLRPIYCLSSRLFDANGLKEVVPETWTTRAPRESIVNGFDYEERSREHPWGLGLGLGDLKLWGEPQREEGLGKTTE